MKARREEKDLVEDPGDGWLESCLSNEDERFS
jgi:hypothetical protein